MPTPQYKIDDLVYLRSSAEIGELESYVVGAIHNKGGSFVYQIFIDQRPPKEANVGDRISLKRKNVQIFFSESELLTFCDAITLAIETVGNNLTALRARAAAIGSTVVTPAEGSSRFDIGDTVYIRASAKIGFRQFHKVTNIHRRPNTNQWVYELDIFGDRRVIDPLKLNSQDNIGPRTLYFKESELLFESEALALVIFAQERKLEKLQLQFDNLC